jgi:intracellular multiplication protein IcmK
MKSKIASLVLLLLGAAALAQNAGMQRVAPAPAQPQAPMAAPVLGQQAPAQQPALQVTNQQQTRPMPAPLPGMPLDRVEESVNMIAPLTAEEILRLRRELNVRQKAAVEPLIPQGKPSTRLARIDLSPGATPEVIRISMSEGAVVSFIDAAGRPWNIENADSFNPTGFDIAAFGKNGLSIAAKMEQAIGNVAVRLEGMSGAITFKVLAGHTASRDLDYAIDLQVPRYLPGVPAPVGAVIAQPSLGVGELMDYLLRTPPRDARELKVEGIVGAMAWQTPSGRIMLRTDKMVLSPDAKRRQSSSDGMTVYELPVTPVALVSDNGRLINVQISGFSISTQQEARK